MFEVAMIESVVDGRFGAQRADIEAIHASVVETAEATEAEKIWWSVRAAPHHQNHEQRLNR